MKIDAFPAASSTYFQQFLQYALRSMKQKYSPRKKRRMRIVKRMHGRVVIVMAISRPVQAERRQRISGAQRWRRSYWTAEYERRGRADCGTGCRGAQRHSTYTETHKTHTSYAVMATKNKMALTISFISRRLTAKWSSPHHTWTWLA